MSEVDSSRNVCRALCRWRSARPGAVTTCDEGRGPTTAVVSLHAGRVGCDARTSFGGTLSSDVITYVKKTINGVEVQVPTIFNDVGRRRSRVDPEGPGRLTEPTT